jgi:NADPH-dependent 2,4-dienoyl-CoA reductase/sulfur reductase-like enzyme
MAAAIEAAQRGCRVTVLDEAQRPGGQIYRQADPALIGPEHAEPAELKRKHALLGRFEAVKSAIDYRPGVSVYAVFPNREVHFAEGDRTEVLRPDAVVLATGVREQAIPFPGWTTPGVMFAGGAQAILKAQRTLPGRNAVVAGCGPLPLVVAAQLLRAGGKVAALALLRPMARMLGDPMALWRGRDILGEGLRYAWTVLSAGVPRLTGHAPVRALGGEKLEAVVLARLDAEGAPVAGTEHEIACDLLAVNYGFVANSELAAMAGATMRRDKVRGGWLPEADAYGRIATPGFFVAGDGAGLRGALVAESEGAIVGAAAAEPEAIAGAALRASLKGAWEKRRRAEGFQRAVWASLSLPQKLWSLADGGTVVCRCENVRAGELSAAFGDGHLGLNAVKRNTRAGMGWCGGRGCMHAVAALAELQGGASPLAMMTPRPMARPVTFAALARQKKAAAE